MNIVFDVCYLCLFVFLFHVILGHNLLILLAEDRCSALTFVVIYKKVNSCFEMGSFTNLAEVTAEQFICTVRLMSLPINKL